MVQLSLNGGGRQTAATRSAREDAPRPIYYLPSTIFAPHPLRPFTDAVIGTHGGDGAEHGGNDIEPEVGELS